MNVPKDAKLVLTKVSDNCDALGNYSWTLDIELTRDASTFCMIDAPDFLSAIDKAKEQMSDFLKSNE